MTAVLPRLILTGLLAALLAALAAVVAVPRDAGAVVASNPRIIAVALVAGNPTKAGTAIVYNATGGVAICISGKCRPAEKSRAGVWDVPPARPLPKLVKGQRRAVIVVATSVGGAFSIYQRTVTVR